MTDAGMETVLCYPEIFKYHLLVHAADRQDGFGLTDSFNLWLVQVDVLVAQFGAARCLDHGFFQGPARGKVLQSWFTVS